MKYMKKLFSVIAVMSALSMWMMTAYASSGESKTEENPSDSSCSQEVTPDEEETPQESEIIGEEILNLSQTKQSTGTVVLSWDKCTNADCYEIYLKASESEEYELYSVCEDNTVNITGLSEAAVYSVRVCSVIKTQPEEVKGDFSEILICTSPKAPVGLKATSRTDSSLTVKWDAVNGADGYQVYLYDSETNVYTYVKTTLSTAAKVENLSDATEYTIAVRAYKNFSDKKIVSAFSKTENFTFTKRPEGVCVTSRTTSGYTLKWNPVKGASCYDVLIYNSKTKTYSVCKSGVTGTSVSFSGLKQGTAAIYKVRPYINYKGKNYASYSAYSVRAVTQIRKVTLNAEALINGVKLTWNKSFPASGYRIFYSESKNGTYTLLKTTAANTTVSYKNTALEGGKTYYFKVVPFLKIGSLTYSGEAAVVSVKPYSTDLNSVLSSYKQSKSITVTNSEFTLSQSRKNAIMKLINNYSNTCGFVMLDINSGGMVAYNADWYVPTASTVKAPYICYVLSQEIDTGNASLGELLTYQRRHYHTGSGVIQYASYGTKYSIKNIIEKILYYSDNVGYYMLQDRFGVTGYNNWLKSLGCKTFVNGTTVKWGKVSARDSAKIWVEIYNYINNGKYGDFFKEELTTTGYSPIRNVLGHVYTVANKFGGADVGWHDTGIVFKGKNPYILILLTDDSYLHPDYTFQKNMIKQLNAVHTEMVKYNNSQK